MFPCLRCGEDSAVWQNDYDTNDMYDREGIMTIYICSECNSTIEVTTFLED